MFRFIPCGCPCANELFRTSCFLQQCWQPFKWGHTDALTGWPKIDNIIDCVVSHLLGFQPPRFQGCRKIAISGPWGYWSLSVCTSLPTVGVLFEHRNVAQFEYSITHETTKCASGCSDCGGNFSAYGNSSLSNVSNAAEDDQRTCAGVCLNTDNYVAFNCPPTNDQCWIKHTYQKSDHLKKSCGG